METVGKCQHPGGGQVRTAEPHRLGGTWVQIPPPAPPGPEGSVAVAMALCDKEKLSCPGPLGGHGRCGLKEGTSAWS